MKFQYILLISLGFFCSEIHADAQGKPSFQQLRQRFLQIETNHSSMARIELLGKSRQGRPIEFLVLNIDRNSPKKKIYLNSGHHGNELASIKSLLGVTEYLADHRNERSVKSLLDKYSFVIQPFVNPDGIAVGSRFDSRGLDPNRDYFHPGKNWQDAFKSPETQLVKKLLDNTNFAGTLTFHSGIEGVFFPWCHSQEPNPHQKDFARIAKKTASAMSIDNVKQSFADYHSSGEFIDFVYSQYQLLGLTIEVSHSHSPSPHEMQKVIDKTINGLFAYLDALENRASTIFGSRS